MVSMAFSDRTHTPCIDELSDHVLAGLCGRTLRGRQGASPGNNAPRQPMDDITSCQMRPSLAAVISHTSCVLL